MRGEISADGKDSLGAHRLKLVEKLLDVVKELQVSAVILFNKSCIMDVYEPVNHNHPGDIGEGEMVEWSNVEKIGGILRLQRSPACILQSRKERPVDRNDLLDVNKGVDERGEDFSPGLNDAAAEPPADKVEEKESNCRQGGHIGDNDEVERSATAWEQEF